MVTLVDMPLVEVIIRMPAMEEVVEEVISEEAVEVGVDPAQKLYKVHLDVDRNLQSTYQRHRYEGETLQVPVDPFSHPCYHITHCSCQILS